MEKLMSLRSNNYRQLREAHPENHVSSEDARKDFVLRIDEHDSRGSGGGPHRTLASRSANGYDSKRIADERIGLEDKSGVQDRGAREGIWRDCSYDFRGDKDTERCRESGAQLGSKQDSHERRAKSFDYKVATDPPSQLIGKFLHRQKASGGNSLDMDLEDLSLQELPLKLPLSNVTETELYSHSESSGLSMSKDASGASSCSGFSQTGSDTTSSSAPSLLTNAPSPADQLQSNSAHPFVNPTVSSAVEGAPVYRSCFEPAIGMAASRAQTAGDNDHPGSGGRTRRSVGIERPAENIVKSPSKVGVTLNRMKSRFSEPPRPYRDNSESGSGGRTHSGWSKSGQLKSGQLKSGQLKSGQLKSQQMRSGIIPRTGLLGRVEEDEEEDPFKDSDFPEGFGSHHWSWLSLSEWTALLIILGALACSKAIPRLRRVGLWGLDLWKWALLLLVVLCGRLVSSWVIRLLVFFLERNFLLRKRVLYFVYALRRGVKYILWLALVLMAWHFMFDPRVDRTNKALLYVTKVLECFLIAAVLFVVKIFLVKVLASSFHVGTYFERIRDSLFNQYILETLSGPPMVEIQQNLDEDQKLADEIAGLRKAGAIGPGLPDPTVVLHSGALKGSMRRSGVDPGEGKSGTGISIQNLHKLNRKNVSAWNMKRLINLVKHTGVATLTRTIDQSVQTEEQGVDTEIKSEWQAKAAAKQIFNNVAKRGVKFIDEDDLMRFMLEEEAHRALALFDGATEAGQITRQALKDWVVHVYRERRALALSLSDTKTAVNKLHRMLDGVLVLIVIIIWLLVLGIATTHLLLFVSSQLLLIVFVFGNTCKTVFEAIIFLFVMHPFDVGDRCVIDNVQYVVEEMNILTTVFLGDANVKVWFPNSLLATKPIQNFYRSPEMGDNFDFVVHSSTPVEKISALKERIGRYIHSKPQHWSKDYSLVVLDIAEAGRLKLSLGLSHTMNHQNFGEKVARRSELLFEMKKLSEELDIEYHLPPQEVHLRTLSDTSPH